MKVLFNIAVVMSMLLSLISCGDSGSGGNNTTGTPPTISNLSFPSDTASSTFGTGDVLTFSGGQMNFKDPDGDVKTLRIIIKEGNTEIKSSDTDITNDAADLIEGILQVTADLPVPPPSSLPATYTIDVLVLDEGNNKSNSLSETVTITP
ncbi:MAG: hypothetical protein ACE5EA_03055 [Nitrospirota bacterium]